MRFNRAASVFNPHDCFSWENKLNAKILTAVTATVKCCHHKTFFHRFICGKGFQLLHKLQIKKKNNLQLS